MAALLVLFNVLPSERYVLVDQSSVLKHIYDFLTKTLSKLGSDSTLFAVENFGTDADTSKNAIAFIGVTDLVQIQQDLNGEKIIIGEVRVPAPTHIAFIVAITVMSMNYSDLLGALGIIIQYLKDNTTIPVAEYNWHGNTGSTFFIEPIVRSPTIGKEFIEYKTPFLTLEYRIETAVNSQKSENFKRVKDRDIRGKLLEESES